MRSIEQIIQLEPVYLNEWENKTAVISDFQSIWLGEEEREKAIERYKDTNILFASYGSENYSGDAWVLFEQDGKLFEVNGSHCSCYGLEGQWEPDEVELLELKNRIINGTFGADGYSGNVFKKELREFLGIEVF